MTPSTPTLRERIEGLVKFHKAGCVGTDGFTKYPCHIFNDLEKALASEPEVPDAPKVERVALPVLDRGFPVWSQPAYANRTWDEGWRFYAERPIPAKSRREEVASVLDRMADRTASVYDDQFLREAARLLREKA